MVPHEKNHEVAEQTVALLLYPVPKPLKQYAKPVIFALMDPLLRRAMKYPDPPAFVGYVIPRFLRLRAFLIRHLFPPRPEWLKFKGITDTPTESGRYFMTYYDTLPYYVKPTIFNRWGPYAWFMRLQGKPVPGDEGDKYYPNGYKTEDVGPKTIGKGGQKDMEARVRGDVVETRCPMGFGG